MRVTGTELNMAEDSLKLAHLLAARLLAAGEEVEEVCGAAVKEEAIEAKLAAIMAQWSCATFTLADYKTRGPVVLQVRPAAERCAQNLETGFDM